MFPIRDNAPRRTFPFVTILLILANTAVFFYQMSLFVEGRAAGEAFVQSFGAAPAAITAALAGRTPLGDGLVPVFTSMFLHGGLMHLLGNMWFLWIFGDNVEDDLGHGGFVLFYLACGLLALSTHYLANPMSATRVVGASGAISGVMGAYLVRFPRAQITTLIPFIIFFTTVELPAVVMLLYWFAIQFLSGASSIGAEGGGVAWWAHIGGFVAGAMLILTRPRRRPAMPRRLRY
jgi:membrane associated rhomboid family serine protease